MVIKVILIFALLVMFTGCGGGGSSSSNDTQTAQKNWVRSHLDDVYLWYNEVIDVPPANYATAPDYFSALLVRSRDRFSYSLPQAEAASMYQEGLETGYGVKWGWGASGRLYAYYVDPNSPAAGTLSRGTEVTAINGQSVATINSSYLNSALFPDQPDVPINLIYRAPATNTILSTTLTSATFSSTTVQQPLLISLPGGGKAGYLLFNKHLATAEQPLSNAMAQFRQQGISELVLDLRYNSGGYLYIAEELASMIGGGAVQGQIFEKLQFNAKHPEKTSDPNNTLRFSSLDLNGNSLPLLGLNRVFILTGSNTCSASESIINSLQPFIQVVRVGWTTCGKPYGMRQTNFDQQAYFAIQFEGVNANGMDNYKTGFSPTCQVADDLNYSLGDSHEARLNSALYYMSNNACPPTPAVSLPKSALASYIPMSGDAQLIAREPGIKLMK